MPKLARISLADIDEPALPIRCAMDDEKMAELVESMRQIGLLQPILLKPANGRYEIEAGHRRYKAAVILSWPDIPALIFKPAELADGAAMLAENVIREDITAAEEALLFAQAQEKYQLDEAGLVKRFRRSPEYIASRLALLRQDHVIFEALTARRITFSVAKELNKCTDDDHRRYLLDVCIRSECGARVAQGYVAQWRSQPAANSPNSSDPQPVPAVEPARDESIACAFCGGFRDPYNLVPIMVHKWELEEIRRLMQRPPEEIEPSSQPEVAATR
jgi:ParB family chromosome partitioning protein